MASGACWCKAARFSSACRCVASSRTGAKRYLSLHGNGPRRVVVCVAPVRAVILGASTHEMNMKWIAAVLGIVLVALSTADAWAAAKVSSTGVACNTTGTAQRTVRTRMAIR